MLSSGVIRATGTSASYPGRQRRTALLASLVSTSLAVAAELPRHVFDLNEPGVLLVLTHPPKRQLSFTLDATRYDVVIVLANVRGAVVRAK